ncbi:MAG: addiction module protein [Bacillota bacterium]
MLYKDWASELERRVAAIKNGTETTVPWEVVRAEALERIGYLLSDD